MNKLVLYCKILTIIYFNFFIYFIYFSNNILNIIIIKDIIKDIQNIKYGL